MDLAGNTILITGGSSGIGLAFAERFAKDNQVIVTGRREALLADVKTRLPNVVTLVNDVGNPNERARLAEEVMRRFPDLNVLVNNAGIQRKLDLRAQEPWADTDAELAINLGGPIHLTALFLPHLLAKPRAAVLNVSSGLAFVPAARVPVYCATKAALHSYTMSLRYQLRGTSVEVVEIIPPAVRSNLGGSHDFGVDTAEYADSVMAQLREGRAECTYGFSAQASQATRAEVDALVERMNAGAPPPRT